MKKLSFQAAVLFGMIMMLFPQAGLAKMTALSDGQMGEITAQAGISIKAKDHVDLDLSLDSLSYGDTDGTDGNAAYLSMNGVSLIGSLDFQKGVSVDVSTEMDPYANRMLSGINLVIKGMTVDIEQFKIDSITVGSEPGMGESFGSFEISNLHAEISGKVRITTHE
jgi:hypothetical protein